MIPLLGLLGPLIGIGKDWMENRNKIKTAKVDAKIERIKASAKVAANADMAAIQAQRYSVKDEILMIILIYKRY